MLGKLMKYELKSMGRILLPLYLVMIAAAGAFSVNQKLTMNKGVSSILEKFAVITFLLFVVIVMAVFVVTTILVIQRFRKNLLGNEGYLMFTLPAGTAEQIASKALSALIWIAAGAAAGGIAGFLSVSILSSLPEFLKSMKEFWDLLTSSGGAVKNIILFAVMIVMGLLEKILKVYAALSVGHQWNGHRILGSVIVYIVFSIVEALFGLMLSKIAGGALATIELTAEGMVNFGMVFRQGIGTAAAGIIIYSLITWYFLDRRLNLE